MAGPDHAADRAPPLDAAARRPDRACSTRAASSPSARHAELRSVPALPAAAVRARATTPKASTRGELGFESPAIRTRRNAGAAGTAPAAVGPPTGAGTGEPVGPGAQPGRGPADRRRRRRRAGAAAGFLGGCLPATPELLAQVAALPPATDEPDVDAAAARARPTRTSRCAGCCGRSVAAVRLRAAARRRSTRWPPWRIPALVRSGVDKGIEARAVDVYRRLGGRAADHAGRLGDRRGADQVVGRTSERLLYTLRVKTFAHLQRLGLDYYEREMSGRIMTRMTTDVDALSAFLQTGARHRW